MPTFKPEAIGVHVKSTDTSCYCNSTLVKQVGQGQHWMREARLTTDRQLIVLLSLRPLVTGRMAYLCVLWFCNFASEL